MGPYRLVDSKSHWEWFSFRFFDDEEIMLFSFPQHPCIDGTYIDKEVKTTRLQNYEIKPQNLVKRGKYKARFHNFLVLYCSLLHSSQSLNPVRSYIYHRAPLLILMHFLVFFSYNRASAFPRLPQIHSLISPVVFVNPLQLLKRNLFRFYTPFLFLFFNPALIAIQVAVSTIYSFYY